jgi:hypothetical protein
MQVSLNISQWVCECSNQFLIRVAWAEPHRLILFCIGIFVTILSYCSSTAILSTLLLSYGLTAGTLQASLPLTKYRFYLFIYCFSTLIILCILEPLGGESHLLYSRVVFVFRCLVHLRNSETDIWEPFPLALASKLSEKFMVSIRNAARKFLSSVITYCSILG